MSTFHNSFHWNKIKKTRLESSMHYWVVKDDKIQASFQKVNGYIKRFYKAKWLMCDC